MDFTVLPPIHHLTALSARSLAPTGISARRTQNQTSKSECNTKECRSIVRGESVYLTMLSGHSRHTHSVSVPNISVLLHTHVEAVLKFEVVSHFAHF